MGIGFEKDKSVTTPRADNAFSEWILAVSCQFFEVNSGILE